MPFDGYTGANRWSAEPSWRQCRSCRRPIAAHEPFSQVQFGHAAPHSLRKASGIYHAACAKPILSLTVALETLSGFTR
jgi:hypothetical protein